MPSAASSLEIRAHRRLCDSNRRFEDSGVDGFVGAVRNIGFQRVPFPTLYHGADLETVDTQKIVDVERCPIAVDAINEGNSVL